MNRVAFIRDGLVIEIVPLLAVSKISKLNEQLNWQHRIETNNSSVAVGWSYIDGQFSSGEEP